MEMDERDRLEEKYVEAGVDDLMALAARSKDFVVNTVEAYEALSQRVKAVEDLAGQTTDTIIRLDQRTLATLEHITSTLESGASACEALNARFERHARLCELRHRDDAEDIAKLRTRPDRAAGGTT